MIAYVVYSQTLKGTQYMAIAKELEAHAGQELQHALTIARQIDYLGGTPTTLAREVKMSAKARGDAAVRPRQRGRDAPELP